MAADRRYYYQQCDPDASLAPDDPRYVDVETVAPGARGGDAVASVAKRLALASMPEIVFLESVPGSGTTTELRRLAAMVGDRNGANLLSVYVGQWTPLIDTHATIEPDELLFSAAVAVEHAVASAHHVHASFRSVAWTALASILTEIGMDSASLSDPNTSLRWRHVLSELSLHDPLSRTARTELTARSKEVRPLLLNALEHSLKAARASGHSGVLVLMDLLGAGVFRQTFMDSRRIFDRIFGRVAPWDEFPAHIVVSIPHHPEGIDGRTSAFLPMIAVESRDGRELGTTAAREIVRRRIPDDALAELFGSRWEDWTTQMIRWSGGSPKNLLHFLREALVATPKDDFGFRTMLRGASKRVIEFLSNRDAAMLSRIHREKQLDRQGTSQHFLINIMLRSGVLLPYLGDRPWYDVHPAVLELLAERAPAPPPAQDAPLPAIPPFVDRSVQQLTLRGMAFTPEAAPEFGPRLNLITGDNSTGKTVVLDALWWALCATWPAAKIHPRDAGAAIGLRWSDGAHAEATFDPATEAWRRPASWDRTTSLVLYARIDEGFSLFDPIRAAAGSGVLSFRSLDVFHGLRAPDGSHPSNGLIEDAVQWQSRRPQLFARLNAVLAAMSPGGAPMTLGDPVKVSIQDAREFPTLQLPYGSIPITHASAAVQHILGLAYLLVWAWHEHTESARLAMRPPVRNVVVLVDEIEAHLHPEWQRRILGALLRAVDLVAEKTSAQVFVVTHAPLVVASAETEFDDATDKLFHFALSDGAVAFEELPFEKEGTVSGWLTSRVFGLAEDRSLPAEAAILRAKELLAANADADALRHHHGALVAVLAPEDPFLVRWVRHVRRAGVEV